MPSSIESAMSATKPTCQVDKDNNMDVLVNAEAANAQEHELSLRQALRLFPKSVMWSFILSTSVVMEGYDTKLISTLFAQPTFRKAFGRETSTGAYEISAPWQSGLGSGSAAGQVIGLLIAGSLSERFGFRKALIAGLFSMIGLIFITFFAHNVTVLCVGQVLFGEYHIEAQSTPVCLLCKGCR
jgi:SP family general alpha glucoside:H+ symporter-like MFS transporter